MFKDEGYEIVRNVVSKDLLDFLAVEFEMVRKVKYVSNDIPDIKETKKKYGDDQVINSFSHYSSFFSESLMVYIQSAVEKIVGVSLYPSYSYSRIYYKGAIMDRHKDRPSCQYSVTFCISNDKNYSWPIFFKKRDGNEISIYLNPGDMVVYSGCELEHWREEYKGSSQMQVFLHYVDSNGPYKEFKYDKRPYLCFPRGLHNC